jgi:hypothetical protein
VAGDDRVDAVSFRGAPRKEAQGLRSRLRTPTARISGIAAARQDPPAREPPAAPSRPRST